MTKGLKVVIIVGIYIMAYGAEYKERVNQYGRRNRGDVVIPLSEVNLACVRLGQKNENVRKLANSLAKGDADVFPSEVFVKGKNGEMLVNLTAAFRGSSEEQVNAIPHARELFLDLQKDATLRGQETIYTRSFREERRRAGRKKADLTRGFLSKYVDHEFGLSTEGKLSHLESKEDREAYKEIETFLQGIVDKLFVASGLKKIKPKVYLTKSDSVNAFVLTQDAGATVHDYIESASDKQPLELPVFIHQGLVGELDSEDKIAGILAHEFAHLLQPDYLSSADQSLQKRLEYDADTEGMRLADAAGFNPRGLVEVFKNFPQSSGKLEMIFGGSHPATDQRIIELEKLFHRGEIPLPNAAKKMKAYPESVVRALKKIEGKVGLDLPMAHIDVAGLEKTGKLEETLERMDGLVDSLKYNGDFNSAANKRLRDKFRKYELVHGTFGRRDLLLARLNTFQALLLKFKDDDENIGLSIPYVASPEEMEMPVDPELDFVAPDGVGDLKISDEAIAGFKKTIGDIRESNGLDIGDVEHGLEDWLSDDPPEGIKLFWKHVQAQYYSYKLNRGYKLFIINNWLQRSERRSTFGFADSKSDFEITTTEVVVKRIPKKVEVKNTDVLDNVPLALRAHRKKMGEDVKVEVEYEEQKDYKPKKLFDFFLDYAEIGHNLWDKTDESCPEAVRDLSGLVQEKAVSAYRNFLSESGFDDLPEEIAQFILRHLMAASSHRSFDTTAKMLAQVPDCSINFFDQAYRALNFQNFNKLNKILYGFETGASFLKDQIFYFVVFLLVPKNEEEERIRLNYLKKLELDPTALSHLMELDEDKLPPDIDINKKLFKIDDHGSGKIKFKMEPAEARMLSAQELVFSEYGTVADDFIFDENLEAMPDWVATADLKTLPFGLAEYLNQGDLNQLEKTKDKITGKEKVFLSVEMQIGRYINVLVGLIDKVKREDLIDLKQIKSFIDQQAGIAIGATNSDISPSLYRDASKLKFLADFVSRYAQMFSDELSGKGIKSKDISKAVEKYLWQLLGVQFSYQDILAVNLEFQAVGQKKEGGLSEDELKSVAKKTGNSLAWYLYRRKDMPISGSESVNLNKVEVFGYLDELAKQDGNVADLKAILLKISKGQKEIPQAFLALAVGHLKGFKEFVPARDQSVDIKDVLACLRIAEKIYGNDWKPLEQYRRFDEQISIWEWSGCNPLIKDKVEKEGVKKLSTPLVEYIQTLINSSSLTGKYEVDKKYIGGPDFSWPLFLDDFWNGGEDFVNGVADKIYGNGQNKNEREKHLEALRLFKKRLHEVVNSSDNLKEVFGMQAGFFKEFILNKKMEVAGAQSLEEIEGYMEHFTAYTHEGSKRNQLPGLMESVRSEIRNKRKKELFIQAAKEVANPEKVDLIIHFADQIKFEDDDTLSDRQLFNIHDHYFRVSAQEGLVIWKRMQELLSAAESEAGSTHTVSEADLSLYSDHIVENDKSRLEIGPVYRLRWLAQPLMNWHTEALSNLASNQESSDLFARVEKDLPEKHPLRDLFVKNQLAADIWQILGKDLGDAEGSGFALVKKEINIEEALKKFPLNAENSFLKSYSIFEVSGLIDNIHKLSPSTIDKIILILEDVVNNRISPDQQPAMRRLLFNLEQKTKLNTLKQERKSNPQVFDDYLDRVLAYYPGPSLERDDILEQTVMELAQTKDQIRKVWSLRYQEQTRWANEDESVSEKTGFEAAERARLGITQMNALDRSQYLLWMLGGKTPLSELFTAQETGISLEERKNSLWQMTKTERRSLLYELMMGDKGIMQPAKYKVYAKDEDLSEEDFKLIREHDLKQRHRDEYVPSKELVGNQPRWERPGDMIRYTVDSIFEQTFGDQSLDPNLDKEDPANKRGRELMQTVFHELFLQQKDSARRTELMINIVEAVGKNKYEGKSLTPGELMKLLLEQIGVVGVKVGQVLSEQPGLLPESMQRELATLKDQAATFSKRGVLTYLEAAGWVNGEDPKIVAVADCIGSASIKQVMEGKTKNGDSVAVKVKRPSIDKNFSEDMELLQAVLSKVKEKGFNVPSYLINEVRDIVLEELSFIHESDNQLAMKRSLQERKATIPIEVGGITQEISLSVSAPLSVSEVLYPTDENTEDIGLMVEEFVRGLSLKNIQEYQTALTEENQPKIEKMRKRVGELYGQPRIEKVEKQIKGMNVDNLQAQLAIDLLRQISNDGIFHADLHGGNFYLDFNPSVKDGVFSEMQGVFIDLGSVGFSKSEAMPQYQKEIMGDNFNASADFRDFITALFSIDIMPEGAKKKISEMVGRYAGLDWDEERVGRILSQSSETETRVKSLFYSILEQKEQGQLNPQFRALLKTLATAAGHFDKLKSVLLGDNPESLGISPDEMSELVNFDALAVA